MERVALCAELLFLAELSAEDVREKKVSVYKVLVFTVLALIYRAFTNQLFWMEMIINLVPGGMMILLAILTKEGIGPTAIYNIEYFPPIENSIPF